MFLTMAAVALVGLVACGEEDDAKSCSTTADCGEGMVCREGSCAVVACDDMGDCLADETCGEIDGSRVCTEKQCDAADPCPTGETCNADFICVPGEEPPDTVDATDVVGETTTETEEPGPYDDLCAPCVSDSDCSGDAVCKSFQTAYGCATVCETNADCPSGFTCLEYSGHSVCISDIFDCSGCLIHGCPEETYCRQEVDSCWPIVPHCGYCERDAECGPEGRCIAFPPDVYLCVPECQQGVCPESSECVTSTTEMGTLGVPICMPSTEYCCFGEGCSDG